MHAQDNCWEKRTYLKGEALELARCAKAAMKEAKTVPEAGKKAREMDGRANELMAEAEALKGAARLEDLAIWVMEKAKTIKKGSKTYGYWIGHMEGGR